MDVTGLAAGVAIIAHQRGSAIEAQAMAVRLATGLAGTRIEGAPDQRAGGDVARCFDSPAHGGMDIIVTGNGDRGFGRSVTHDIRRAMATALAQNQDAAALVAAMGARA